MLLKSHEKPWEHATVDSQPHNHGTTEHRLLSFLLLDGVVKLLQSPMSQLVYTGSLDGKVRAWDGCTGNCECTYQGHKDSILDIASTKDVRFILSGSDDNTARAFEGIAWWTCIQNMGAWRMLGVQQNAISKCGHLQHHDIWTCELWAMAEGALELFKE